MLASLLTPLAMGMKSPFCPSSYSDRRPEPVREDVRSVKVRASHGQSPNLVGKSEGSEREKQREMKGIEKGTA